MEAAVLIGDPHTKPGYLHVGVRQGDRGRHCVTGGDDFLTGMTRSVLYWVALHLFWIIGVSQPVFATPCLPSFPYQKGWLGGDSAYSIRLSESKAVWLFGDSFVAEQKAASRSQSLMVANSIGISTCNRKGEWSIEYFWGDMYKPNPKPFFRPQSSDKLWPKDGFVSNGKLYLFLDEINNRPDREPFGFEGVGSLLAEVSNPYVSPKRWKIRYYPIIRGKRYFPGVSAIKKGRFVYVYTVLDDDKHKHHPMILLRLGLDDLRAGSLNFEYLDDDGTWRADRAWTNAKTIIEYGATELSVRYVISIQSWVLIQNEQKFLTNKIVVRFSPDLRGPWGASKVVYEMPEMKLSDPLYDKDTFCYAAKAHEETKRHNKHLIVTYACNSFDFSKLVSNMVLYRPQVITLKLTDMKRWLLSYKAKS